MELTYSPSQQFRRKPKILQLIKDCQQVYVAQPNSTFMGINRIIKLLYWHGILKHVKRNFIGKYFQMDFFFDTSSDGAARLYIHPYIEYSIHRFVKEWVRQGSICFDVGSHIGFYPLLCSSMGGITHSFEANPEMVRIQTINVLLNNFSDLVKINQVAVSDKNSYTSFYRQPNGWAGISSLYKDPQNPGIKIKVKTTTIDSYINKNKIKKVDFLKIDIEGAEGLALKGAQNNLANGHIKTIIWESNYRSTKDERLATVKMLNNYGYKNYALDEDTQKFRSWNWGDEDCISVHKSVLKEFAKFIKSVEKKFVVLES